MVMFIEPTLFILAKQSSRYFIGSICGLGQALQTSILWLEGINLCTNKNIARSASIAVPATTNNKTRKNNDKICAHTAHTHIYTLFHSKMRNQRSQTCDKMKMVNDVENFRRFFFMRTGASFPYLHTLGYCFSVAKTLLRIFEKYR